MLAQINTTIQQTTGVAKPQDTAADQLDVYRPQIVAQTYQARLSTSNITASASFIGAMIARIGKQVYG